MRIEIDTKHDTKEELAHLANMLKALACSSTSGSTVLDSRLQRKLARKNLAASSAPGSSSEPSQGGLFNLFNDPPQSSAQSTPSPTTTAPASQQEQPAASGDLFSLFGSTPEESTAPEPAPQAQTQTVAELLQQPEQQEIQEGPKEEGTTSVNDVLDDDRIVPY